MSDRPSAVGQGPDEAPSARSAAKAGDGVSSPELLSEAGAHAPASEEAPGPVSPPVAVIEPPLRTGATLVAQGALPPLPPSFVMASALVVALLAFAVYAVHGCRTVYFFDSAEFTVGASRLGIVHPSGYPLYLLLGRLTQSLLSFLEPAHAMNLMSGFFGGATIFFLFLAMHRLTDEFGAALVASLCFAFSFTFWSLSLVAEVYTLQTFFLAFLLWYLLGKGSAAPRAPVVALVVGLGLSSHLSLAFVVPGVLVYLVLVRGRELLKPKLLALCLAAGLAGLSFYALLPIASSRYGSAEPWLRIFELDLARPGDLLWFVSGRVFLQEYGKSSSIGLADLRYFVDCLTEDLGIVPVFLGVIGMGWMLARGRRASWILLPGFLITSVFYLGYRVVDRYTMFCGAFLLFSMWVAFTMAQFVRRTREVLEGPYVVLLILFLCCLPLGNYFAFRDGLSLVDNRAARTGAEAMVAGTPEGAMLVTDLTVGSLIRYVQELLGKDRKVEPYYFGLECLARRRRFHEGGVEGRVAHQRAFDAVVAEIEARLLRGPVYSTLCNHAIVERFTLSPRGEGLFALSNKRARIAPPDGRKDLVQFGDAVALTELRCSSWKVRPGDLVRLTYSWRKLRDATGEISAVVRLVDEQGRPVVFHRNPAGHDHRIGGRAGALDQLEKGWSLEEAYELWFPPTGSSTEIPPGNYRLVLQVGLQGFGGPFLEARQGEAGGRQGRTVVVLGTFEVQDTP